MICVGNIVRVLRSVLVLCFVCVPVSASAETAFDATKSRGVNSPSITTLFAGNAGELIAFDGGRNSLVFYDLHGSTALHERATVTVQGAVSKVSVDREGYLVATGAGINDRNAPIRIYSISSDAKTATLLFEKQSPRAEVTGLKRCGEDIWIDFFNSKYFNSIGYLVSKDDGTYDFKEQSSIRMGSSFDCLGDMKVVGRSYGDIQGADGDVLLIRNGAQTLLPSYRGVRGVRILGENRIVIGDGWHSNYGKIAQGRISLLSRETATARFRLEIIAKSDSNYNFTEFNPISYKGGEYLVVLGSKEIGLVSLGDSEGSKQASFTPLYTQKDSKTIMDVVVLKADNKSLTLAVLDGTLTVHTVSLPTA